MSKKTIKETIHAKGLDIAIFTHDYTNEYVSLTDIAKYRSTDPRITIHNWLRGRDIVEFLGLWEVLHNPHFKRLEFDTFKIEAGTNAFVFSIKKWTDELNAIGLLSKSGRYGGGIYALFGMTAKEWRTNNKGKKGNIRDYASLQQLLVLANMESYNAVLIKQGIKQSERLQSLRSMAIQQLKSISELSFANLPLAKGQSNDET
ncbi:MAG: KilA-N domain-containing protein [bacterium]|nr:KilA-N domain-containing protein [bacterium]